MYFQAAYIFYIIYTHVQVRKHFTVDDHSHYLFTPRDLTRWVLGLLRYPLSDQSASQNQVLEAWSYEARRLFRDRLIGDNALDRFDSILNSVLRSDWSTDMTSLDQGDGALYVTWGSPSSVSVEVKGYSSKIGRSLGRLSGLDMQEVVAKAMVTYGKSNMYAYVF